VIRSLTSKLAAAGVVFALAAVVAPVTQAGRFGPGQPGATASADQPLPRAICHQYCGTVRNDPAADRTLVLSSKPAEPVPQVTTVVRGGFHWADAGIGAAAAAGLGLLALGAVVLSRRQFRRRPMLIPPVTGTLALAGVLLLAGVLAAAGGAAGSGANGLIAYHEFDANGAPQIWVVAPDGSHQAQLTSGETCGGCASEAPQWSPDGSRIYFDSDRAGNVHIFSMKSDGADVQQVTSSDGFDGFPAVSPDEAKLAYDFSSDAAAEQGIWVADIDGGGAHQVTSPREFGANSFGWDTNPDYGLDGWIAFQRFHATCPPSPRCDRRGPVAFSSSIWIVREDGSGLRRLTSGGRVWGDPQWSPDGSKLLLHTYDDGRPGRGVTADIYAINADGSGLHPLTRTRAGEFAFTPDWSPDGTKIVFHHFQDPDDHVELWQMNADGSGAAPIADCSADTFCDWANWGTHAP